MTSQDFSDTWLSSQVADRSKHLVIWTHIESQQDTSRLKIINIYL